MAEPWLPWKSAYRGNGKGNGILPGTQKVEETDHANQSNCKGFCIFNSIAIGVEYLKSKFPDKKIVIIDWDVHHGDGTQKIFYDKKNPLFISIHRHDKGKFYPQITGFTKEKGEVKAKVTI